MAKSAAVTSSSHAKQPEGRIIHSFWVRATHWVNAVAMMIMISSGWRIYNAAPIFNFEFPNSITIGGWLAGALMWHFAAMWLLVINGLIYVTLGIFTGRFQNKLFPIWPSDVMKDIKAALTLHLSHEDLSVYNAIQRVLYLGVIVAGVVVVFSGVSIWKPSQLQELTALFGGYDFARVVHFIAMSAIVGFLLLHVLLAILIPRSLLAMIRGY
jgi:thiosulfate reductase cytochrome b subunit